MTFLFTSNPFLLILGPLALDTNAHLLSDGFTLSLSEHINERASR